jgi:hypothetical protein
VCQAQGIIVGPGQLFCSSQHYQHYLRLSFAGAWGPIEQEALADVGRLAQSLPHTIAPAATTKPQDLGRTDFMWMNQISAHDLW